MQQLIYGGFAECIQKVIRTNSLAFVQSEDDNEWLRFKNLYTDITAWPWPSQELQRSCSCLLKWTPKNLVAWFALGCLIEVVVICNPLIISPFETSGTFTKCSLLWDPGTLGAQLGSQQISRWKDAEDLRFLNNSKTCEYGPTQEIWISSYVDTNVFARNYLSLCQIQFHCRRFISFQNVCPEPGSGRRPRLLAVSAVWSSASSQFSRRSSR